jgi:hypothetical protein
MKASTCLDQATKHEYWRHYTRNETENSSAVATTISG